MRQWIEPPAAAKAASRITPAQLKRLHQACADYSAYEEYWKNGPAVMTPEIVDRALAAENAFHGTIMVAAGNDTAARIIENLRVFAYNRLVNLELPPAVVAHLTGLTVKEHRGILAALSSGTPAWLSSGCAATWNALPAMSSNEFSPEHTVGGVAFPPT